MIARKWRRRILSATLIPLSGASVALGVLAGLPGAAHADPSGVGVVHNVKGEAGYFANDNGHTRFRDVQAQVGVTNGIKNLDGAGGLGGLGAELCDPNTGYSVQLGVQWTGTRFQVSYGHGTLGDLSGSDPCIMSGLVSGPTPLAPIALNPVTGDQLRFEIYYNPTSHWITVNACDLTQDVCRQAHFNDGFKNLYEFGIGAVSNGPSLTAPADNFLAAFSHTAANYYSSTRFLGSINVPAHWSLKRSDWVNSSDQVVMSSNGSLNSAGTAFSLFNGSTSA
jgi:hypothetical protein